MRACVCGPAGKRVFHSPISFLFSPPFCQTTVFSVISICCGKAASSFSQNGPLQIMSVTPNHGPKADFTPPLRPFPLKPPYHSTHRFVKKRRREGSRVLSARADVVGHVQSKHSLRAPLRSLVSGDLDVRTPAVSRRSLYRLNFCDDMSAKCTSCSTWY